MSALGQTPLSMRMTIAVFGRTNSGKSSLINAVTGQKVSLVSEVGGTTTDPVSKTMELYPVGPCVWVDTAGFDDSSELGAMRMERTRKVLDKTDLALLVIGTDGAGGPEEEWLSFIKEREIPVIGIQNKADLAQDPQETAAELAKRWKIPFVCTSTATGAGIDKVKAAVVEHAPQDFELPSITGHLVDAGDSVLLVMPQDMQAPKGRLILPQVQVTRDLLDLGAVITSCTTERLCDALDALREPPKLIITDSQVFPYVFDHKPEESLLTSFSVLMARYKGDVGAFREGAEQVDRLTEKDRVLIAEACTHNPLDGDIGREKIPKLLRKKVGEGLQIDIVGGNNFPEDLSGYSLIVHCGGCMFNRRYMLNRIRAAKGQRVPITNYGILLAKLGGILEHITTD